MDRTGPITWSILYRPQGVLPFLYLRERSKHGEGEQVPEGSH
nr:MAG TPA: hypothetical protein [Caudoviricetes sp.]